ncbi:uncharacterized protein EV422DRAFT_428865 [Fimicolochytrium jonesii]|uniref:uncharacterized protein n=1 Tax=Fimicolochytrium jonesii TaxID=1396493 RepID=UPI0022FE5546|nr:uncharacterized protein EV422DRAFT_428865 [Fimicolochytrium jonesii]KAI8821706.1 hypothetical protein EV422DRAFT_428865 [Fimicolochytrium jonesii]
MSWRQLVHNQLVDALANNKAFQKIAVTTTHRFNELSGKGAQKATQIQQEVANPEQLEQAKEKMIIFMEEFRKEIGEGIDRSFGRKN